MTRQRHKRTPAWPAIFKKAEERMPFGMNKPEHIAQLALFLASADSDQITGQIFSVSGGLSFPG